MRNTGIAHPCRRGGFCMDVPSGFFLWFIAPGRKMLNTQCADQYHSILPYRPAVSLCTGPFSPPSSTNACWSERRRIALTFVFCTVGDLWCFEQSTCWIFAIQFVATKKERVLCKKTCTDKHSKDPKLLLALYFDNSLIKCESFCVLFLLLIHLILQVWSRHCWTLSTDFTGSGTRSATPH